MYKACSRCGKIHDTNYKCKVGIEYKPKYNDEGAELRNTYKWHNKAEQIKEDSNYLCSVCFDKGIYNYNDLEVHHIIKVRDNKERLLDDYNLICLCKTCHKLAESELIKKDYLFDLAKKRIDKKNSQLVSSK